MTARIDARFLARLFRKLAVLLSLALAFVLLFAQLGQAQSLNFYKNYFVTGDYAVGGVGMEALGLNQARFM